VIHLGFWRDTCRAAAVEYCPMIVSASGEPCMAC